jgi:predicted transcriptional regulator
MKTATSPAAVTHARHTPGPWVWNADRYSLNTHTESAGHCVVTVLKWDGCTVERDCDIDAMRAEIDANKSLIAAAPELLAALQAVCDSGVMLAEPIERAMLDALQKAQGLQ